MAEQGKSFGAELRRRRVAAGLSLAQLAARIHYSKGYLSKIETGHKPPGSSCTVPSGVEAGLRNSRTSTTVVSSSERPRR